MEQIARRRELELVAVCAEVPGRAAGAPLMPLSSPASAPPRFVAVAKPILRLRTDSSGARRRR